MPFKSQKQMKACFATKGFSGKVDCEEWAKKTPVAIRKGFKEWLLEVERNVTLKDMETPTLSPEEIKKWRDKSLQDYENYRNQQAAANKLANQPKLSLKKWRNRLLQKNEHNNSIS